MRWSSGTGRWCLRVCRRLLDDPNDAEDAFQATFLVLLRRAGPIRDRGSVAAWLHGVAAAGRVSRPGRIGPPPPDRAAWHPAGGRAERRSRSPGPRVADRRGTRPAAREVPGSRSCSATWKGSTHEGAADRLGWPVGTVRGRLSRARDLLRSRLTRRGVTASAALAAVGSLSDPAKAAVPAALRDATVRAAAQVAAGRTIAAAASAQVAAWVAGASRGLAFYRTEDGRGRAALARDGRDGPGSGDARRVIATAAGRAHHAARLARGAPSRDAPAQGDLVHHGDGQESPSTACPSRRRRSR